MTEPLAERMKALVSQLNLHARNHVDPMSAWEWCAEELAPLAAEVAALERQHFDATHWLSVQKNDLQARLEFALGREAGLEAQLQRTVQWWQAQLEACDEARQSNADAVAPLVAALERIAAHDDSRWDWSTGVAERQDSPQEVARAALGMEGGHDTE